MRQGTTFALALWLAFGAWSPPSFATSGPGSWSLPDESRGSRVAPLFLLSRAEVRDDLLLSADQAAEVDKAILALFEQALSIKGKTGEAAVAARKAVDEGQKVWLEKHLTPEQVDRLWQIDLRWEGPSALATRPTLAETLSLSVEQKAVIDQAVRERNAQRVKPKDAPSAETQLGRRIATVLSDGQKERWEQLLGRPLPVKAASATAR